jgi:hypothetical protein
MDEKRGHSLPLSAPRKWMSDLVALSGTLPIAALEHRLCLKPLIEVRDTLPKPHPSWVALFLKAFALVARHRPQLRRGCFNFPWPRLYEHPHSVAAVTAELEWKGEPAIFFDMLTKPEEMGLMAIHQHLRDLKNKPIRSNPHFRMQLLSEWVPLLARRLAWRWLYSLSGPRRAERMGTFAVNGGTRYPIRPVSTTGPIGLTLYFGLFDTAGCTDACLTFDHRVMDGGEVVRALEAMEAVLNTDIRLELESLR